MRTGLRVLVSLVLIIALLVGCAAPAAQPTTAPATQPPAPAPTQPPTAVPATAATTTVPTPTTVVKKEPIKVGVLTTLTGSSASVGQDIVKGATVGAELLNELGGIDGRPIELVVRDDKAKPDEGVAQLRELKSQGVTFVLGTAISSVAIALGPAAEKEGVIVISTGVGTDVITHEGFNKHMFRISESNWGRQSALLEFILKRYPDVNKWANISPDYEFGHTSWDNWNIPMKAYNKNYTVVSDQWPAYGAPDLKPQIAATLAAKPEALFSALFAGDAVNLAKQAKPYNFFSQIKLYVNPSTEWEPVWALGSDTPEMWTGLHSYAEDWKKTEIGKKYYDKMVAKYGTQEKGGFQGWANEGFNALIAYKTAIEKAKSTDVKTVIAALEGLSIDTAEGTFTIRATDHQALANVTIVRFAPQAEAPGFKVAESHQVVVKDDNKYYEPATPGVKIDRQAILKAQMAARGVQ